MLCAGNVSYRVFSEADYQSRGHVLPSKLSCSEVDVGEVRLLVRLRARYKNAREAEPWPPTAAQLLLYSTSELQRISCVWECLTAT